MFNLSYPIAKKESLPAAIAIAANQRSSNKEQIFCSGVPIQADVILTAAHCVNQFQELWQNSNLTIKTSHHTHESVLVSESYIHPYYQESASLNRVDFDAALLKLDGRISNDQHSLAAQFIRSEQPQKNFLWMKGFSPIRLNASNSYEALTSPETWNQLEYAQDLPNEGKIRVIVGKDRRAPCPGDSGAPVWQITAEGATLRGIVVQGNCEKGEAKILKIVSLSDWLNRQIQIINAIHSNQSDLSKIFRLNLFVSARMPH